MKTIKEWLETLPEPVRSQAMENTEDESLDILEESLNEAISGAFYWIETPEGYEYWSDIAERAEAG